MRQHTTALWTVNAEAWRVYHLLGGRTVGLCELRGDLFRRITAGWPLDAVLDLVRRVDLILDVLDPVSPAT